jgi:hypothetical protein
MGVSFSLEMLSTDEGILVVVRLEPGEEILLFSLLFVWD